MEEIKGAPLEQLGRYRLVSRLGQGGMAEVFLARFEGPGGFEKTAVIKRIKPELAHEDQYRRMFIQEARVMASLSHSHVLSVLDFGEANGNLFLVLEHVEGADLARALDRVRPLAPELAVYIASCVLRALGYVHARRDAKGEPMSIVHRDITPANILLGENGDVKLGDFGVAKVPRLAPRTAPGTLKGKLSYMSPEQAAGAPVDGRSDLFAVGLVLLEALTGKAAYPQESNGALMLAVREAKVEVPDSLGAVAKVVRLALEKNPAKRFADADAMSTALFDAQRTLAGPREVSALVQQVTVDSEEHVTSQAVSSPLSELLRSQRGQPDDESDQ